MTKSAPTSQDPVSSHASLSYDQVTVTELRKNIKKYVGGVGRTVVTRDNQPASVLLHVKDFNHREALLRWAMEDPKGWAEAMAAHRRVQREGVRGIELDELEESLGPAPDTR